MAKASETNKQNQPIDVDIRLPPDPLLLDFSEVIRLIAFDRCEPWLKDFFIDYSTPLWMAMELDRRAPSRKELKTVYDAVVDAARTIRLNLDYTEMGEMFRLAEIDTAAKISQLRTQLDKISISAIEQARCLTTEDGKVKPGRGRAVTADTISQYVFCAAVIAEVWKHIHNEYPAPRNEGAQAAAAACWKVVGGTRSGHSPDPRSSWRGHLEKALNDSSPSRLTVFRSEVRRHLAEAAKMYQRLPSGIPAEKSMI